MSALRKIISPESKKHDLRHSHLSHSHRMIIAPGDVEGLLINSCLEIPSEPVSEMQSVMIVNDIDELNRSIPLTEEDPNLEDSKFQALSISFYNKRDNDTCLNRTLMSPSPITALLTPRTMHDNNRDSKVLKIENNNKSNMLSMRQTPSILTGRNTAMDKSVLYSIAERMASPANRSMLNASKIYNRIVNGAKSPKDDLKPKPRMAVKGTTSNHAAAVAKLERQLSKDKYSTKTSQQTTQPNSRQDVRAHRTKVNPEESFYKPTSILKDSSKSRIKTEADTSIYSPRGNQNTSIYSPRPNQKIVKNVSKENLRDSSKLLYKGKEKEGQRIATRFIELKRNREMEASESSFKKKEASSIINLSQLRKDKLSVERPGSKQPYNSPQKKVLQMSILNSISPEKSVTKMVSKQGGLYTSRDSQTKMQKLALYRLQAGFNTYQSSSSKKKGMVSLRDTSVESATATDQTNKSEFEEFATTNANLQKKQTQEIKHPQTAREDRTPLNSSRVSRNPHPLGFAYGFGSASTKALPGTSKLKRDESSTDLSLKGANTERSQVVYSSIKKLNRDESSADLRSGATTERGGNKGMLMSFQKMIRDESSPDLLKKPNTERGPLGRYHDNDGSRERRMDGKVKLDEYFEEDGVKFYQYQKIPQKKVNNNKGNFEGFLFK